MAGARVEYRAVAGLHSSRLVPPFEGCDGSVGFVALARAADSRSRLNLAEAVDEEGERTFIDAGDNVREAVLLQVEEAAGQPSVAVGRLVSLAVEALIAAAGIRARYPLKGGRLIGVMAVSGEARRLVGVYRGREEAIVGALDDAWMGLGRGVSAAVMSAWREGRLEEALVAWHEGQATVPRPVRCEFLDL